MSSSLKGTWSTPTSACSGIVRWLIKARTVHSPLSTASFLRNVRSWSAPLLPLQKLLSWIVVLRCYSPSSSTSLHSFAISLNSHYTFTLIDDEGGDSIDSHHLCLKVSPRRICIERVFSRRINTCPRGDFVAPSVLAAEIERFLSTTLSTARTTAAASPVSLSAAIDVLHTGLLARANSFHCRCSLVAGEGSFVRSLTDQCGRNALSQGICN